MEVTSKTWDKRPREMFYFRQRLKNRVFNEICAFFEREAVECGMTKKILAERLKREPSQITRWLSSPGNLTLETISDLLFAMEAEPRQFQIQKLSECSKSNFVHPVVANIAPSGPTASFVNQYRQNSNSGEGAARAVQLQNSNV
jgi:hypothetical protein